jgi:hypothetical protein
MRERLELESVLYWTSFPFAVAMNLGLVGISFLPSPEHAKDFNYRGKRCQAQGEVACDGGRHLGQGIRSEDG